MPATRVSLRLFGVLTGAAMAIWLLPASIHIVNWPATGPSRIALFAPLYRLWLALGVAGVLAGTVGLVARSRGGVTVERVAAVATPFGLLWLWAVPYLPWLPDRAPVLLALAGPPRWGIAGLALCGAVARLGKGKTPGLRWPALPGRLAVFVLSLGFYLAFGLWSASEVVPGGDEPHYLVITQSLILDHDVAIENNHERGDYRRYFGGRLRPDFLRRGRDDVIYSIHAPGLSALVAPAFVVAGYPGAVATLGLFGALAALAIFDLAALLGGAAVGWLTWAAVCLTVPFVPHAWQIYPEMPGAAIVAWGARWLYRSDTDRPGTWVGRGLVLSVLPWLHTKFVVLLAALALLLLFKLRRQRAAAACLATAIAVSGALWLYSFYALYGVVDPQVPYGDSVRTTVLAANLPRGVLGLLFDQKFGLLPYAPVYGLAVFGFWAMTRSNDARLLAFELAGAVAVFVGSTARYYMWWGGSSAPARFLVPALPLVAPMIAAGFRALRSPIARSAAAVLLAVSLAVAIGGSVRPERLMLFSPPHGVSRIVESVQNGAPLALALPTFTEEQTRPALAALAAWSAAAVLAILTGALAVRGGALSGVSAALVTFFVCGAVISEAPPLTGRLETTARGRLELLREFDGPRQRGFDYVRRTKMNEAQLLAAGAVTEPVAPGDAAADPRRIAGPFELPPGSYVARIWLAGQPASEGSAFVAIADHVSLARRAGTLANPIELPFTLLVQAAVWPGASDAVLAALVRRVDIVADAIVPRSARTDVDVRAIEAIEGRDDGYLVYADRSTYPEGGVFWTKGTKEGTVFVAPGRASTLVLTLHVGPVQGNVRVRVYGRDESMELAKGETRVVEIPITPSGALIPITIQAPGSFRPADDEAGSTDQRRLGCQVRIGLK